MGDDEVNAEELWSNTLEVLKGQMTLATFQTTFGGSRAGFFDGETLDVALVSQSACEWAGVRLARVIERVVGDVAGRPVTVRFSSTNGAAAASGLLSTGDDVVSSSSEVRDQRRVGWYRVDNVVLDDYLPLMGVRAFAVYSLYCRMSGRDGLSWPGYAYVCKTLGIGRTTLAKCNAVLEVLGLIEVDRGNRERSNRYYLLEPELLTFEVVSRVRERAEIVGLRSLVDALEVVLTGEDPPSIPPWRGGGEGGQDADSTEEGSPVGDYPSPERGLPQSSAGTTLVPSEDYPSPQRGLEQDIVNKTQEQDIGSNREKRERTRKDAKNGSCVCESGSKKWDPGSESSREIETSASSAEPSDNDVADWLVELGMGRPLALKLVLQYERELIVAWIEYIVEQDTIKNPVGFLRAKLKGGGWP